MKFPTTLLVLLAATSANAFTILPSPSRICTSTPTTATQRIPTWVRESSTAVAEAPDATEKGESALESVYARLGITKDQLAIGINPAEVLEWIGT